MHLPESFATELRRLRHARSLTQAELDAEAGLAPGQIAHYEVGRRLPSLKNLCRIADALEVALDTLVARSEAA